MLTILMLAAAAAVVPCGGGAAVPPDAVSPNGAETIRDEVIYGGTSGGPA
jgi:hypothetical protein